MYRRAAFADIDREVSDALQVGVDLDS
jgi:hypothetical protein